MAKALSKLSRSINNNNKNPKKFSKNKSKKAAKKYILYSITDQIEGDVFVGVTDRSIEDCYAEHVANVVKGKRSYLYSSMRRAHPVGSEVEDFEEDFTITKRAAFTNLGCAQEEAKFNYRKYVGHGVTVFDVDAPSLSPYSLDFNNEDDEDEEDDVFADFDEEDYKEEREHDAWDPFERVAKQHAPSSNMTQLNKNAPTFERAVVQRLDAVLALLEKIEARLEEL